MVHNELQQTQHKPIGFTLNVTLSQWCCAARACNRDTGDLHPVSPDGSFPTDCAFHVFHASADIVQLMMEHYKHLYVT